MKDDKAIEKRLISGGGAALGSLAGWALAKWREAEEAYPYAVVGGLLGFAATEAAMYFFGHPKQGTEAVGNQEEEVRKSITTMIEEEGKRLGYGVDPQMVMLGLKRFDLPRLLIFQKYLTAYISHDNAALASIKPEFIAKVAPIIESSHEWTTYKRIILYRLR